MAHFFFGITPNLVLLTILLLNLFEAREEKNGIFAAAIGGFFWDIFSDKPLGFHLIILVALSLLIKAVIKKYIEIPNYHLISGSKRSYGKIS